MNDTIEYDSKINSGVTVILPNTKVACELGQTHYSREVNNLKEADPNDKVTVTTSSARGGGKKTKEMKISTLMKKWKEQLKLYDGCVNDLQKGVEADKNYIKKLADEIVDYALMIDPSLSNTEGGWQTAENGPIADSSLVASGVPNPCFKRRHDGEEAKDGAGDGAYRVVICTDKPYWGQVNDNSAYITALVTILQNFGPVEIWIQQGWLHPKGDVNDIRSGVTLFKLDADGGIDPTQLAFWTGHRFKDAVFSHAVNSEIGRTQSAVSTVSEIPCDVFLYGTWMKMYGIDEGKERPTNEEANKWHKTAGPSTKQERLQMFSEYLIDTVKGILYSEDN